MLLRPEQLRLSAPAAASGEVLARVGGVDFFGHDARIRLTLADGTAVTARLDGAELPAAGASVAVTVRGSALAFPASAGTAALPV